MKLLRVSLEVFSIISLAIKKLKIILWYADLIHPFINQFVSY
jgi:hypothetical protein